MNVTSPIAPAHADAGPTERDAARRASRFVDSQRARLLQLVIDAGDAGLTAPEAYELYVGLYGDPAGGYNSIAPRLSQMRRQYGQVDFGTVRGRRGAYVATEAGLAEAGGLCPTCPHVAFIHDDSGCHAASGCDCSGMGGSR